MTDTTKEAVERLASSLKILGWKLEAATLRQLLTERDAANEKLASARNGALVADFMDSIFSNTNMDDYPAREWTVHQWQNFWDTHVDAYATHPTTPASHEGQREIAVTSARVNLSGDSFIEISVGHSGAIESLHSDERAALRNLLTNTARYIMPKVEALIAKESQS
jgi:hypothetical protein